MPANFLALLLFDNFSGQYTPAEVFKIIYTHHMHIVLIPPNLTNHTTASQSECT